ncbi:MAG TPA: dihydrofolate reductase [Flavobacteriales bacterium]|nr:dihydrofolate reductase [Flavobacteriales bacterium]HRE95434.1 dihydrofolate reductase [Flavobacteriales bacterium]HRJ39505.1 dihydrofolate reductase [Flavobacteriales bacterium]
MRISLIVATAPDGAIGKDNKLLWHLPADMKYFRETTSGHCVITGRKNYESIPEKFRPLPNRTNIVLTRNKNCNFPGAISVSSLQEAIKVCQQHNETEAFIIGGAEIYRQAIDAGIVDRIYLTLVDGTFDADAYFQFDTSNWIEKSSLRFDKDDKNPFSMTFFVYEKA